MYEELLPYWKARCRAVLERKGTKRNRYDMRIAVWQHKVEAMGLSGLYNPHNKDCLVGGVMLFTWEAGIAPWKKTRR